MLSRTLTYFFILGAVVFSACSETASDDDEYANWKQRNEQFLAAVASDSLQQPGWQRIKNYSLNPDTEGALSDYVYVKEIESGDAATDGSAYPAFTDSARVAYQGRLIPSKTYPEGKIFDGTVYGTYNDKTNANAKFLISSPSLTTGFCTVLQHMRRGDHWRVYIPAELAYGASGSGSNIPGYSLLIFEMTLIDFSPAGQAMPVWSSRQKRLKIEDF